MEVGTNIEKSSFLSPIKNISILLLISGIVSLIIALPFLIISTFLGIIQLIVAVGLIATSFGLRKMKRWALYGYTVITLLNVIGAIYSFVTSRTIDNILLITTIVFVAVLIYFWINSKKFN